MKSGKIGIFLLFLLTVCTVSYAEEQLSMSEFVIIGASVSADHSAPSPGKFLAKQVQTDTPQVKVKAKNGKKSTYHSRFIQDQIERLQPDILVAIDLFYHDFKIPKPLTDKEEEWIQTVLQKLSHNSGLVILGTALGLEGVGGATAANALIYEIAADYDNIIVIDVNTVFKELHSAEGYHYDVNGVSMQLYRTQVLADYIHPNPFGSKVLANLMIDEIRSLYPSLTDEELPYISLDK